MHKSIKKSVRFSKDEYELIEKNLLKYDVKFSDFARAQILKTKLNTNCNIKKTYQIQKIGTNLNQIARKVNENFKDKIELLEQLHSIENMIKKL